MFDFEDIRRYEVWKNRWQNPDSMDMLKYISFNIHPEDFLIAGSLMMPEFIEVNGCVFLESNYSESVYNRMQSDSDSQAIEKGMNHMYVYDLFGHAPQDVENVIFERIAEFLQISWSMCLARKFPGKNMIVEYLNSENQYGPSLTIYQGGNGDPE